VLPKISDFFFICIFVLVYRRISDNQFTGAIPDFIQNWKGLEKL